MMVNSGLGNAGHDSDGWDRSRATTGASNAAARDTAATELPDPRKLAQDWITLWQSELSAMAVDPEIRESWQTVMALWAGTMSAMLRGLPHAERHDSTRGHPRPTDAPRAPTAAAAPDARDAEIERLARHVAALERRLADLERGGNPPVDPKSRSGRKSRR